MTTAELKTWCRQQPFKPFKLRIADGRAVPVNHQAFIMLSPSGRTALVYQPDGELNVVDVMLVTDLEVGADGANGKRQ